MNGKKFRNWKKDRKTGVVSVSVPAGQGKIEMNYEL